MVSVIIPNYNHSSFLRQRIESVLNQTYQNFELIILDDCSTDDSRNIIEEFRGHSKIQTIIYNEKNSGSVFKQWQKGIENAKGEYVWIAESDDFAEPTLLETLYDTIKAYPQVGLAYCDSYIVDEDGLRNPKTMSIRRKEGTGLSKWENNYVKNGRDEIKENLSKWCTVNNVSSALFRRTVFEATTPFDLHFKYMGDWYVYLKLCTQYDIAFVNKPLSYYREHSANTFKNSWDNILFVHEYFLIFDYILDTVDYPNNRDVMSYFLWNTRHAVSKNLNRTGMSIYRKLLQKNAILFCKMMRFNIIQSLKGKLGMGN